MFGNGNTSFGLFDLIGTIESEKQNAAVNGPTPTYPGPQPAGLADINDRLVAAGIAAIVYADRPDYIVAGRCRCFDNCGHSQTDNNRRLYVERFDAGFGEVTRVVAHDGPQGPRLAYLGDNGMIEGRSLTPEQKALIEELARDYAANPPYPVR